MNENFDAKMNTLRQHVNLVKCEIGALKVIMEKEFKQKTLDRALALIDLKSFVYYDNSQSYNVAKKNSSELAKTVIKWFMVGYGSSILSNLTLTEVYKRADEEDVVHAYNFSERVQ